MIIPTIRGRGEPQEPAQVSQWWRRTVNTGPEPLTTLTHGFWIQDIVTAEISLQTYDIVGPFWFRYVCTCCAYVDIWLNQVQIWPLWLIKAGLSYASS